MSAIIEFKPVLRDMRTNFWILRAFFGLILLCPVLGGVLLWGVDHLDGGSGPAGLPFWLGVAFSDIFPPATQIDGMSAAGVFLRRLNGLVGYILLGLIFHVIRESFRDHRLKESRYVFLSTDTDARR